MKESKNVSCIVYISFIWTVDIILSLVMYTVQRKPVAGRINLIVLPSAAYHKQWFYFWFQSFVCMGKGFYVSLLLAGLLKMKEDCQ